MPIVSWLLILIKKEDKDKCFKDCRSNFCEIPFDVLPKRFETKNLDELHFP
jgi:hypothetical protein